MAFNTAGQTLVESIAGDAPQYAEKVITFDATSITAADYTRVTFGFKPRRVQVTNLTDRVSVDWSVSNPTDNYLLTVAAGTRTLDTTAGLLVVNSRGVDILQNATVGLIKASKVVKVEAWA